MTTVSIPYGGGSVSAELPDRAVVIPNTAVSKMPAVADLEAEVRGALDSPLDSPRVEDLVTAASRVTIAFDDATVLSYGPVRGVVIRQILERLKRAGVDEGNVTLICANSLHRKFRPGELAMLIGRDLVDRFGERLFCHDAEDAAAIVNLGVTEGGYDVEVSRHVVESDLTVYVNAAYNRGFSGGWKSVCVGLSTYKSIRHHHTPNGMSMSVHGNRMHEMLDEMGRHLESRIPGKIFKVDTISSGPFAVGRILAGSVGETRRRALAIMDEQFPPRRDLSGEKFDALIYGVPAWSPYAIFSFMNPILTLISSGLGYLGGTVQALGRPGCTVIMVTPCPDKWDHVHHASYPHVWENVLSQTLDPWEIMKNFADRYASDEGFIEKYRNEFAFHPIHAILATYPLARLSHIGQVICVGLENPEIAARLGFRTAPDVETALAMVREIHGPDHSIACVEQPVVHSKAIPG